MSTLTKTRYTVERLEQNDDRSYDYRFCADFGFHADAEIYLETVRAQGYIARITTTEVPRHA